MQRKKKPAKGETRAAVDAAIIKGKRKAAAKTRFPHITFAS